MALAFDIFFSNCCLGNGRESSRWLEQIEDDFWISLCIFLVPSCSARHCTAHVFHMPVLSLSLFLALSVPSNYTLLSTNPSLQAQYYYFFLQLFIFIPFQIRTDYNVLTLFYFHIPNLLFSLFLFQEFSHFRAHKLR